MLKKDKKLEHGSSSTLDLQRILGVSYQQVSLSRVKKMTAAVITVVALILFISLSFHSAATSNDDTQIIASPTSPKAEKLSSNPDKRVITTSSSARHNGLTFTQTTKESPRKATSKKLQSNKKKLIQTTKIMNKITTTHRSVIPKDPLQHTKLTTTKTTITSTTTRKPTLATQNLHHTDIVPIPTRTPSKFVLAMNPSIPATVNLNCHSCAVVTNSADLYRSNAGSVIDSSDCVIRLNIAPTFGYEDDVGGKTTVRVVSQDHLGDLLHYVWRDPEEIRSLGYIITYGKYNHLCKNCTFFKLFKKVSGQYLGDKFIRFTETLKTKTHSREEVPLSTQFHAIDIMRDVCRKMRVFGVERNHPCLSDRSYMKNYWHHNKYIRCDGRRQNIVDDIHRYRFEKNIYDEWIDKYDLEFLYP
ncbi:alpha-N-acetyl-neuraminyl-2,3-beta-galactosyl-1,3-N-acetyl-galactosaminide alpha-2,6-sialyltransferase isoform X2 [Exaiptasia diaphana]|nr:alpha-N-acetyl-neuraminyl-2,3-beta-galactosyl-1,3-N-acetyl-galactosaminide alpha-2,6-sialyltransferase isoform X2 [Exaiptasia diaphana]